MLPTQLESTQNTNGSPAKAMTDNQTNCSHETETRFPMRPGYGSLGIPIVLRANYFELMLDSSLCLYRYTVEIDPSPNSTASNPRPSRIPSHIILCLLRTHFRQDLAHIATDGHQNLISRRRLSVPENALLVQPNATDTYHLRVRNTGTLALADLLTTLSRGSEDKRLSSTIPTKEEFIQALNIVIGHYPRLVSSQYVSVGSNRHFEISDNPINLGPSLSVLRGLFVSVRSTEKRLLVNVQPKYAACYEAQPLDRLMLIFLRENGPDMSGLAAHLRHLRIELLHLSPHRRGYRSVPRTKTIVGLAMPGDGKEMIYPPIVRHAGADAEEVRFFREANSTSQGRGGNLLKRKRAVMEEYTSVSDYFRQAHQIILRYPRLPVVNTGTEDNPSYLPAEVCWVLPNQLLRTTLSPAHTRQLLQTIQGESNKRKNNCRMRGRDSHHGQNPLASKIQRLLGPPSGVPSLRSFGCSIDRNEITVPGRILPAPIVNYGCGRDVTPEKAAWTLQGVQFLTPSRITYWTVLSILGRKAEKAYHVSGQGSIGPPLACFRDKLIALGVKDCPSYTPGLEVFLSPGETRQKTPSGPLKQIHDFLDACKTRDREREPQSTFVLVTLPEPSDSLYNMIKYLCDVEYGLPNICVVREKLIRANDQFLANLALKVNIKLNGRNHLPRGVNSRLKQTMVVGIDVTHPTQESKQSTRLLYPSVAAMVASIDDRYLAHWPAAVAIQASRQEMVTEIDMLLASRLRLWQEHNNGTLPENILIYRDGVSETQYKAVLDIEYPLLRKACDELYNPNIDPKHLGGDMSKQKPRISIVTVAKRHHTRFFSTQSGPVGRNPKNGTVVDREVVSDRFWDFYLQSHTAVRGTARPGHYVVIHDEIFQHSQGRSKGGEATSAADDLQTLTHDLCYSYGRATRVPSVVPPVVYADLVCSRVRCYLSHRRDSGPEAADQIRVHPAVRDTMFYV